MILLYRFGNVRRFVANRRRKWLCVLEVRKLDLPRFIFCFESQNITRADVSVHPASAKHQLKS